MTRGAALRLWAALLLPAAAGAALGAWAVDVRALPVAKADLVTVEVAVLGKSVFRSAEPPEEAGGWTRWTTGVRATLGGLLGLLAGVVTGGRPAAAAFEFGTFRVLEAVRGTVLGASAGAAVCGAGFALLGAVVSAMLNESTWTAARGARMGGSLGTLLGVLGGAVLGVVTALSGAARRYQALRAPRP
jgi:hypothetical protein